MMKKTSIIYAIFIAQTFFAQIISKDPSFGVNGEYIPTILNSSNVGGMGGEILQLSNGSLYYSTFYSSSVFADDVTSTRKLSSNGSLDTSFGNNSEAVFASSYTLSDHTQEQNGKLLVINKSANSTEINITRLLSNGQPDLTFGTNGKITTIFSVDFSHYSGFAIQNDKILVYGNQTIAPNVYNKIIYRLNPDGSTDTSFGNNGLIISQTTLFTPNYNKVLVDKQSNIINFTINSIEKYTPDGQPFTSFGNNGKLQLPFNYYNVPDEGIFVDENNKIIFSKNDNVYRVNPNGTFDSTFNYVAPTFPPPYSSPFANTTYTSNLVDIKEKNGFYYLLWLLVDSGGSYGGMVISKHLQNGTIDPAFGSYSEVDRFDNMYSMIINDNNIIVAGNGRIVKYLMATPTLASNEANFIQSITFENPANDLLVYKTQEKISKIQMYTLDGKLVKTIEKNNTNISELPKGIYFLKIKFINGKVISTKLLKK